jgi:PAS domain S-box-containing protein
MRPTADDPVAMISREMQVDASELFHEMLERNGSAILGIGPGRRAVLTNRRMAELVGYTEEELLELKSTAVLSPPDEQQESAHLINEALQGRQPPPRARELLHRDGTRVPVFAAGQFFKLSSGQVLVVVQFWPLEEARQGLTEAA